jgi:sporulation protein YlmC with PRC-barrel domain
MHFGLLNEYKFADQGREIRGTLLYGEDNEKLGTIHDVLFDHETGNIKYAVIDTGGWLKHKYFLVPANRIMPYEKHEDHFYAKLRKEQIQYLPPYDPKVVDNHDQWTAYEKQYEDAWTDEGGVLHAKGSPRIITPEHDQTTGVTGGVSDVQGRDIWPKRIEPITKPAHGPTAQMHPDEQTPTSAAVMPTSSGGSEWELDERLRTFEGRVKKNLPEIRKSCTSCGCDTGTIRKVS